MEKVMLRSSVRLTTHGLGSLFFRRANHQAANTPSGPIGLLPWPNQSALCRRSVLDSGGGWEAVGVIAGAGAFSGGCAAAICTGELWGAAVAACGPRLSSAL